MRVCAGMPIWGASMSRSQLTRMLELSCEEDLDGIWVGDHVALGDVADSPYPYKNDGRFFLKPDDAWYEAFVCLGYMAAVAEGIELGTGVALPLLRPPALLAKQVATLSRLTEGNFVLGAGAGWLKAEFDAVGTPFSGRGRRLEDCIRVLREYWTGHPTPGQYGEYSIPQGIGSYPVPTTRVPVMLGGNSDVALSRAARISDGWLGAVHHWQESSEDMTVLVSRFMDAWRSHPGEGNQPEPLLGTVQALPLAVTRADDFFDQVANKLADYADLGLTRVIFNLNWDDLVHTREVLRTIKSARDSLAERTTLRSNS